MLVRSKRKPRHLAAWGTPNVVAGASFQHSAISINASSLLKSTGLAE